MFYWSFLVIVMSGPETINTDSGKWMRRDVFLEEFLEDDNQEEVNNDLNELIEDGSMKQRTFGDDKYLHLESALPDIVKKIQDRGLFIMSSDLNE